MGIKGPTPGWSDYTEHLHIDNFISNSGLNSQYGLLRPNRFICKIGTATRTIPKDMQWDVLEFQCPGISLSLGESEVDAHMHYYLKTRSDTELSIVFLETADLKIRKFWHDFMKDGFDHENQKRNYIEKISIRDMKIIPIDSKGYGKYCDYFDKVFPFEISELQYNMESEDSILKTTVKFKYSFHKVQAV
jgi:hypothetical protein